MIGKGKIIRNSAICLVCGECLESKSVHDYRVCICGNLMVDGGKDYIRRGYRFQDRIVGYEPLTWKETSAYEYPDEQ